MNANVKKLYPFLAALLLASLLVVSSALAAAQTDYTAFCSNKAALVFGPSTPLPASAPCSQNGTYVVTDPWSDTIAKGETKRFTDWTSARSYASGFNGGSVWFEPGKVAVPVATVVPANTPVPAQPVQTILNWTNWCAGVSPLVFTGGGILNAGPLVSLTPPCSGGAVVVIEPWRPGCQPPADRNPNCNVGKAWMASDWNRMVNWLREGDWTEGSLWYRPNDTVPMGVVQSSCVRALVPEGTAINTVAGAPDPCLGVDRPPADPTTATADPNLSSAMTPMVVTMTVTPTVTVIPTVTPYPTYTPYPTPKSTATPQTSASLLSTPLSGVPATPEGWAFPSVWWHWVLVAVVVLALFGLGLVVGRRR